MGAVVQRSSLPNRGEWALTDRTRELAAFISDPKAAKESGALPLRPPPLPANPVRNWKR